MVGVFSGIKRGRRWWCSGRAGDAGREVACGGQTAAPIRALPDGDGFTEADGLDLIGLVIDGNGNGVDGNYLDGAPGASHSVLPCCSGQLSAVSCAGRRRYRYLSLGGAWLHDQSRGDRAP